MSDTKGFLSTVGRKRGKYAKLTKAGKMVGFLHPKFGFKHRQRHGAFIPVEVEYTKDGERVTEIQGRTFNCAGKGCPLELLIDFSDKAIQDGAHPDELILDGGRNTDSWTLGQLAGKTTGKMGWKYDLRSKQEHVVGWITNDPEEQQSENPVQIMSIGAGLGTSIKAVIEDRQEQKGETAGDPMQTPYGLRLVYKKEADNPSDKYSAFYADAELAPVTAVVREIMQADEEALGIDLGKEIAPSNPSDILKALRSTWISRVVTFEMFLESMGLAVEGGREPEPEGRPAQDSEKPKADGKKFCPECGVKVLSGVKFCPVCGMQQKDSASASQPPASQPPVEGNKQKVKCPEDQEGCGQMVIPTKFGYCPNCGKKGLDCPF